MAAPPFAPGPAPVYPYAGVPQPVYAFPPGYAQYVVAAPTRPGPLFQNRLTGPPLFSQNGVPSIDGLQAYIQPGYCCNNPGVQRRIGEVRAMVDADPSLAEPDRVCAAKMLQYFENIGNPWIIWVLLALGCPGLLIGLICMPLIHPVVGGPLFGCGVILTVIACVRLCQATGAKMACVTLEQERLREVQNAAGGVMGAPPGAAPGQPGVPLPSGGYNA